jgi:diacylglycerol kinase
MWNAWRAAARGIIVAWRTERHLKVHSVAALAVVCLGLALKISSVEWAILTLAMGLVLAAEYANSALERLADRVSMERHPLIRDAKDFAAASVLVAALAAAVVGLLLLGPKLWIYVLDNQ